MTKLKRMLASFLVLSQICSVSAFAVETQETDSQASSYSVSIPESVDFGTLSHEEENYVTYQVSVTYTGESTPAISVTSGTTGILSNGEQELTFSNDMDTAILSSDAPSAVGTLSIDQTQVVQAQEGIYQGTVQFTIDQASTSLSLSASSLTMSQGAEKTVTATLVAGDGYTLSVQSSDEQIATATLADNVVTITAVNTQATTAAAATITVLAEKEGSPTLQKTVDVTVSAYGDSSSGGSSGDTGDEYLLDNGYYYVDLWLWHQYADQASMGDVAFQNNRQALVKVSNGKVTTVEVATSPVNISGIESAISFLEVEGEDIGYLERELFTSNTNDLTFYYIKRAEFTMPSDGQPTSLKEPTYLDVRICVPDTPMDMVADDDGCMTARFKFDWSTAEATDDKNVSQNDNMSSSDYDYDYLYEDEEEETAVSQEVTTTAKVTAVGVGTASFKESDIEEAIEAVLESKTSDEDETLLVLEVTYDDDYDILSMATTIALESFQALAENVDYVKLDTPVGYLRLSTENLTAIADACEDDVVITLSVLDITETAITDEDIIAQIGERTIVQVSITSDDVELSDLGGSLTLAIPYDLGYYDSKYNVVVYAVAEDGSVEEFIMVNYSLSYVSFTIDELGIFATAYNANRTYYDDVGLDSWCFDAVGYVTRLGLFQGTTADLFSPDAPMTRAMLVTVLYRLVGEPSVSGYSYFMDVGADRWYSSPVLWATENGLVNGYGDGTFGTDDNITREQIVSILYRYAELSGESVKTDMGIMENYTDVNDISVSARQAMSWAVERGYIQGTTDLRLLPQGYATRGQVATILMRFTQE